MRFFVIREFPIGPLTLYFELDGIHRLDFGETKDIISCIPADGSELILIEALKVLGAYFRGESVNFNLPSLPLHPDGTAFQKRVWRMISEIPYGEVITYGALAKKTGNSKAARAVGGATGRNPIPILIPCHRVLGMNNRLTGFSAPGGIHTKKKLLMLEKFDRFIDHRQEEI